MQRHRTRLHVCERFAKKLLNEFSSTVLFHACVRSGRDVCNLAKKVVGNLHLIMPLCSHFVEAVVPCDFEEPAREFAFSAKSTNAAKRLQKDLLGHIHRQFTVSGESITPSTHASIMTTKKLVQSRLALRVGPVLISRHDLFVAEQRQVLDLSGRIRT